MLHLTKLAVGVRDIAHLRELQAARLANGEKLRHRTRNFPRRAAEIVAGGSLYWVIAGAMVVRQRVTAIVPDTWEDGSACAALMFHRKLVPVLARPTRAFQGWRYLEAEAAPPDITRANAAESDMPPAMVQELRVLGLL